MIWVCWACIVGLFFFLLQAGHALNVHRDEIQRLIDIVDEHKRRIDELEALARTTRSRVGRA